MNSYEKPENSLGCTGITLIFIFVISWVFGVMLSFSLMKDNSINNDLQSKHRVSDMNAMIVITNIKGNS